MSFNFTASGTPKQAISQLSKAAANEPKCPPQFTDAINLQLGALPEGSQVSVSMHGHTGWGRAQTKGSISLHAEINVTAPDHPSAQS